MKEIKNILGPMLTLFYCRIRKGLFLTKLLTKHGSYEQITSLRNHSSVRYVITSGA